MLAEWTSEILSLSLSTMPLGPFRVPYPVHDICVTAVS